MENKLSIGIVGAGGIGVVFGSVFGSVLVGVVDGLVWACGGSR